MGLIGQKNKEEKENIELKWFSTENLFFSIEVWSNTIKASKKIKNKNIFQQVIFFFFFFLSYILNIQETLSNGNSSLLSRFPPPFSVVAVDRQVIIDFLPNEFFFFIYKLFFYLPKKKKKTSCFPTRICIDFNLGVYLFIWGSQMAKKLKIISHLGHFYKVVFVHI